MLPLWSIWFLPNKKGREAFGWLPRRVGKPFRATYEDATLECYLVSRDERAPDFNDYARYELRYELGGTIPQELKKPLAA